MSKLRDLSFKKHFILFSFYAFICYFFPLFFMHHLIFGNSFETNATLSVLVFIAFFYYIFYIYLVDIILERKTRIKTKSFLLILSNAAFAFFSMFLLLYITNEVLLTDVVLAIISGAGSIHDSTDFNILNFLIFIISTIILFGIFILASALNFITVLIPTKLIKRTQPVKTFFGIIFISVFFITTTYFSINAFTKYKTENSYFNNLVYETFKIYESSETPGNFSTFGPAYPYILDDKIYILDPIKNCMDIFNLNGNFIDEIKVPSPIPELKYKDNFPLNFYHKLFKISKILYVYKATYDSNSTSRKFNILKVIDNKIYFQESLSVSDKLSSKTFLIYEFDSKTKGIKILCRSSSDKSTYLPVILGIDYPYSYELYNEPYSNKNCVIVSHNLITLEKKEIYKSNYSALKNSKLQNTWSIGTKSFTLDSPPFINSNVFFNGKEISIFEYKPIELNNLNKKYNNSIRLTTINTSGKVLSQIEKNYSSSLVLSNSNKKSVKSIPYSNDAVFDFVFTVPYRIQMNNSFYFINSFENDTLITIDKNLNIKQQKSFTKNIFSHLLCPPQMDKNRNLYLIRYVPSTLIKINQEGKVLWKKGNLFIDDLPTN